VLVVRDAPAIRAFDLVVAATGSHALPAFARLVRSTWIAALPAMVVCELQVDAIIAAYGEPRASAAARAIQTGQIAITGL
jgi:hypothetical protein